MHDYPSRLLPANSADEAGKNVTEENTAGREKGDLPPYAEALRVLEVMSEAGERED